MFFGRVFTELLVAGDSGAVFNIFTKLKLRDSGKLPENPQTTHEGGCGQEGAQVAKRQGGGSG